MFCLDITRRQARLGLHAARGAESASSAILRAATKSTLPRRREVWRHLQTVNATHSYLRRVLTQERVLALAYLLPKTKEPNAAVSL
jgi:hypothetical protein